MYHLDRDGIRLQAWIMLQHFVPTATLLSRARSIPAQAIILVAPSASLKDARAVQTIRTPAEPWAYAGRLELDAQCLADGGWLVFNARVLQGRVAVGVLTTGEDDFVARQILNPTGSTETINLRIESLARSGAFIISNADQTGAAELEISDVRLAANGDTAEAVCPIIGNLIASERTAAARPVDFTGAQVVPNAANMNALIPGSSGGMVSVASGTATIIPPS
jgi:hypothetical protein